MLIDDDEDDRKIFIRLGTLTGLYPMCGGNKWSGCVEQTAHLEVLPELIFLDLNMPLMNGREFFGAEKNREILKSIPIVILTTSSDKATMFEMSQLGASAFITKPDRYSDLELILETYLERTPLR